MGLECCGHDHAAGEPQAEWINPCLCGSPRTQAAFARIEADISRREALGGSAAVLGMFAGFGLAPSFARAQTPGRPTVLANLAFFDGNSPKMHTGREIVVEGGKISAIVGAGQGPQDAVRIDCGGRSVTPGLIDCHWHATLVSVSQVAALTQDIALIHLIAGQEAGATLMRGFTTVRDTGGPAFGLKMAVDRGVLAGPRIFPSGAMISQTSGHGDFRFLNTLPRMDSDPADYTERTGVAAIADGEAEVLRRTREQLMKGASQIKIMAGGGVSSLYDPLDTAQFLEEEMRAAVRAAADWGTYVCSHVYTSEGIQRALRAGVRSIEHGQLADEATIRMMKTEGAWWSIQPFLADEDANPKTDPVQIAKQEQVSVGTVRAFEKGRAEGVKMAFGTDILMNPGGSASQGRQLAKLTRFMSPFDALRMATGAAGELLAMSGERAPYPGKLGVIEPGALADMLVWDGDPAKSLDFIGDPATNLKLVMKGGRVFKEALA
jgi:imidazolonepropionase-like amidohydrolase